MKTLNSKELLKKYKSKVKDIIIDDEFIIVELLSIRNSIIDMINSLTDSQLNRFLKIDSDLINLLPEIYKIEENLDIKDSVNDGSYKVYNEMQSRRLVA